jgi:hypothetical protein
MEHEKKIEQNGFNLLIKLIILFLFYNQRDLNSSYLEVKRLYAIPIELASQVLVFSITNLKNKENKTHD